MEVFTPVDEPPFCPNPECVHHRNPAGWRPKRAGTHERKHAPHVVQRFQCVACKRSFSTQTFRLGYWCRRQDLYGPVFQALMSCSGLRQIGRQLGLTRGIVTVRTERLGRHCLLLHQQLRPRRLPDEPVVLDGFETFEHSQFAPVHLNLLVGAVSLLVHGFTESELRRKGRMTAWQKRRRKKLEEAHGRPDSRAVERGVRDLIATFVPVATPVVLASDDHRDYPRAIKSLPLHHVQHSVTPSTARRTASNPLHAVNLTDLLLRHDSANHKRETIAFSKRRQCVVDRGWIFVIWRNFLKSRSEKRRNAPPAVHLGIVPATPTTDQLFARRLFPTLTDLPPVLQQHYWRRIKTRYLARQREHRLKYAF